MFNRRKVLSTGAAGFGIAGIAAPSSLAAPSTLGDRPVHSAGPFGLRPAGSQPIPLLRVGVLLPAVQRLRVAPRIQFLGGNGVVVAQEDLLPPAGSSGPVYTAQFDVAVTGVNGDVPIQISRRFGETPLYTGSVAGEEIYILVLGAVDSRGRGVAALSGSVQYEGEGTHIVIPLIPQGAV